MITHSISSYGKYIFACLAFYVPEHSVHLVHKSWYENHAVKRCLLCCRICGRNVWEQNSRRDLSDVPKFPGQQDSFTQNNFLRSFEIRIGKRSKLNTAVLEIIFRPAPMIRTEFAFARSKTEVVFNSSFCLSKPRVIPGVRKCFSLQLNAPLVCTMHRLSTSSASLVRNVSNGLPLNKRLGHGAKLS